MTEPAELISIPLAWLAANAMPLLSAAAVLIGGWYLAWWAARVIRRMLPRAYGVDKNFAPLLAQATRYGIIIFSLVTALSFIGVSAPRSMPCSAPPASPSRWHCRAHWPISRPASC